MTTALLGLQATAGLSASVLGLEFGAPIAVGEYEVGARSEEDNPVRKVEITESYALATTATTNRQFGAGLNLLEDQTTVVSILAGNTPKIIARGTKKQIEAVSLSDLRKAVGEVLNVGDVVRMGGFAALREADLMEMIMGPITLEHRLEEGFAGAHQPVINMDWHMSQAFAALFPDQRFRLPTDEEWEIAAGELREERYLNIDELRKVAHFYGDGSEKLRTEDVKSRTPNEHGLYEMLGNVWEWMAKVDKEEDGSLAGTFRGGSWYDYPANVRAALRYHDDPSFWDYGLGFRLLRPQDS